MIFGKYVNFFQKLEFSYHDQVITIVAISGNGSVIKVTKTGIYIFSLENIFLLLLLFVITVRPERTERSLRTQIGNIISKMICGLVYKRVKGNI